MNRTLKSTTGIVFLFFLLMMFSIPAFADSEVIKAHVGETTSIWYYSNSSASVSFESGTDNIQCWNGGYSVGSDGFGYQGIVLPKKIGSFLVYLFNSSGTQLLKTYIIDVEPYSLYADACVGQETTISFNECSGSTSISASTGVTVSIPNATPYNITSGGVSYSYTTYEYPIKANTAGTHTITFTDGDGKTIANCQFTVHDHIWGTPQVTKEATCTDPGEAVNSCKNCGYSSTNVIPATGHVWNEEKTIDIAATCTDAGSKSIHCSVCEIVDEGTIEEIPATGHTEIVVPASNPSCTEPGLTAGKKCSVCGEILEEQKEVPAKGHTEKIVAGKKPTCTESGLSEGKICSVCGETLITQKEIPAKGHTDTVLVGREASCTESGLTSGKKCSVCGEILEAQVEIPALGHDFGEWKDVTAPSCTKDGKKERICSRCNEKEQGTIPATGHTYVTDPAVESTCTEAGLTEGSHCSVCGNTKTKQEVIPAKGHNWSDPTYNWTEDNGKVTAERVCKNDAAHKETETVEVSYKETKKATCTESGGGVFSATFGNKAFAPQTKEMTIPAMGHTEAVIPGFAATCTEVGLTEGKKCSVCGTVLVAQKEIPATSHTEEIIPGKEATCKEPGLTEGKKCSVCGEILEAQKVIPTIRQHSWNAGDVTKKPTTSAAGVKTFTCTVCGETKTESIAKLPPAALPADPVLGNVTTLESKAKSLSENGDPAGSSFCILQVKGKKVKKTSITIAWKAVPKATGYVIYGAPCGSKYAKLKDIKATSFTQSGLKKGKYYKYFVSAHDKNGNIIASSKTIHIATSGGKKGNTKSVKLNKKKVTLKKGKKFKLKATLKNGKLKVSKHRKVAYETDNPKVATVSKSGKVKAVGKGKCTIYAYAQNGVFAKCKITVK